VSSLTVRPEASATITVTKPVLVAPAKTVTQYSYSFGDFKQITYPTEEKWSLTAGQYQTYAEVGSTEVISDYWYDSAEQAAWRVDRLAGVFDYQPEFMVPEGWTYAYWDGAKYAYLPQKRPILWKVVDPQLQSFDEKQGRTVRYRRTITGLVPGATVRFHADVDSNGPALFGPGYVRFGVTGKGYTSYAPQTTGRNTYTFTATATTHEIYIEFQNDLPWFSKLSVVQSAYTRIENDGLDGWVSSAGLAVAPGEGINGGNAMVIFADGEVYIARAFTGLTIGHSYTLRGKQRSETGAWQTVAQTYTAASTAQSFSLTSEQTGEVSYWTDMELIHHVPAVYTNTPQLPISDGKVRLDENYSPYVTANFTVPLSARELLEQIDPRTPQRVTVTATEGVSGVTRTYNLGLRSRAVDFKSQTIAIELASDEILLHDRKLVATTVDSSARQYETSLRAVCNWALGKIGATLAPGTADANMTAAWDATNLMTNPTAGLDLSGWSATGGTASRLATGTFPAGTGIGSAFRATMNAGTNGGPYFNGGDTAEVLNGLLLIPIREKQLYRVSAWVRTSVSKSLRISVQQRNSAGSLAGVNLNGPAFTTTANTWHRLSFVFQAYPGAVRFGPYVYLASGTYSAGQTIDITGVVITEGTLDHTFFDGGTTVRTDLYAYSWNGATHQSTSERKAHIVRRPELFDWTPGQSLFDFLQPLINASGLRLFCDEQRVWRLVRPEEYEVPGYVVAQTGHNATEGTDTITRNDDTWADAVVVKYTWTGADGDTQTAYDAAGDPNGKTIYRELEREYPGAGAAAAILNNFKGRGRTQAVTVIGQYGATPGQDASISLPGSYTQTGKVRAVEFDLRSGLMVLETRGLTDALPGSWVLWNPTQTWSQVNTTLKWKDA